MGQAAAAQISFNHSNASAPKWEQPCKSMLGIRDENARIGKFSESDLCVLRAGADLSPAVVQKQTLPQ
jgi:hypothetical protein